MKNKKCLKINLYSFLGLLVRGGAIIICSLPVPSRNCKTGSLVLWIKMKALKMFFSWSTNKKHIGKVVITIITPSKALLYP